MIGKLNKTPSGILVFNEKEPHPKTLPPAGPPKKKRQYYTSRPLSLGEVVRQIEFIAKDGAELVSVARHGERRGGIMLPGTEVGYVVAFFHEHDIELEEKT